MASQANTDTKQNVIWAFGNVNPGSASESATLVQHLDSGTFQLDLTKSLSTSTSSGSGAASTGTSGSSDDSSSGSDSNPFKSYQRMVIAHAIVCVVGFAFLLPIGVLLARYLRTSTPTWYTGHWIAQFGIGSFPNTIHCATYAYLSASWPHDHRRRRARVQGDRQIRLRHYGRPQGKPRLTQRLPFMF